MIFAFPCAYTSHLMFLQLHNVQLKQVKLAKDSNKHDLGFIAAKSIAACNTLSTAIN